MNETQPRGRQHPVLHFEQADNFILAHYAGGETQAKAECLEKALFTRFRLIKPY